MRCSLGCRTAKKALGSKERAEEYRKTAAGKLTKHDLNQKRYLRNFEDLRLKNGPDENDLLGSIQKEGILQPLGCVLEEGGENLKTQIQNGNITWTLKQLKSYRVLTESEGSSDIEEKRSQGSSGSIPRASGPFSPWKQMKPVRVKIQNRLIRTCFGKFCRILTGIFSAPMRS